MRRTVILLLTLFISIAASAQWNNWKDSESVKDLFHLAQKSGKSYFSQFHLYDVREKDIHSSKYREKTGEVPYIYALDFYYASGSYFPESYQEKHKNAIIEVVKKQWRDHRSIPSFSWHLENPYVNSDFGEYMGCRYRYGYPVKPYPLNHRYVIKEILYQKGGAPCGYGTFNASQNHKSLYKNPREWFNAQCKEVADIINQFVDDDGNPIPIILRLWHECEDSWMWWGTSSVSSKDYKRFFIYTEKQIIKHAPKAQILWAYCTDRNWETEKEFMLRYPGDRYVDIIGYDDYEIGNPLKQELAMEKAKIVSKVAKDHHKIAALFETSNFNASTKDCFLSEYLYPLLKSKDVNLGLVQMWIGGPFDSESQYRDRINFLRFPEILLGNYE